MQFPPTQRGEAPRTVDVDDAGWQSGTMDSGPALTVSDLQLCSAALLNSSLVAIDRKDYEHAHTLTHLSLRIQDMLRDAPPHAILQFPPF